MLGSYQTLYQILRGAKKRHTVPDRLGTGETTDALENITLQKVFMEDIELGKYPVVWV